MGWKGMELGKMGHRRNGCYGVYHEIYGGGKGWLGLAWIGFLL
jgi:hypothetical protein